MTHATAGQTVTSWSASLFSSPGIVVGAASCHPQDNYFRNGGRFGSFCLAFPKRALWIQPEHHPAFVADQTKVTVYGPHDEFERRAIDPAGGYAEWISFSPSVWSEIVTALGLRHTACKGEGLPQPNITATSSIYLAQRELFHHLRRGPGDPLDVEEMALTLIGEVLGMVYHAKRPSMNNGIAPRHHALVQDTCAHLNRNFEHNESLTAIAAAVGTSVFHLCRVFRRGTGKTIRQYRNDLRLRAAVGALELDERDLLTIALENGYSGHSHFTAAFRRAFGITPSRFRDCRSRTGEQCDVSQAGAPFVR